MNIVHETPRGYITLELTGKSRSFVVWVHGAVAAERKGTFGLGLSNALERAKAKLAELE